MQKFKLTDVFTYIQNISCGKIQALTMGGPVTKYLNFKRKMPALTTCWSGFSCLYSYLKPVLQIFATGHNLESSVSILRQKSS